MTKEYFLQLKTQFPVLREAQKNIPVKSGSSVLYSVFLFEITKGQYLELYQKHKASDEELILFATTNPENKGTLDAYFEKWSDGKAKFMCMFIEQGWESILFSLCNENTLLMQPLEIENDGQGFGAFVSYFSPTDSVLDGVEGYGSSVKEYIDDIEIRVIHNADNLALGKMVQEN